MKKIKHKTFVATVFSVMLVIFTFTNNVYPQGTISETPYKAILVYDSSFQANSNQTIVNNVISRGYNTVFLYVKLLLTSGTPNNQNLGLQIFPQNGDTYAYQKKVIEFCNLAHNSGLKVFAMNFEFLKEEDGMDSYDYKVSEATDRQEHKAECIATYQYNVRISPYYSQYKDHKSHFHGVVTNLEPWALPYWKNCLPLCTATGRYDKNVELGDYLNLISAIYDELLDKGFYSPQVLQNSVLQDLDQLYMGTVHWNWHYFHINIKNNVPCIFPNGDFAKYTGIHNNKHYFDIILPETYCPKPTISNPTNNCIEANCVEPQKDDLCDGCL